MNLTEEHFIKHSKRTSSFYELVDGACCKSKNVYNSTNYLIRQVLHIQTKLYEGEFLDKYQSKLIFETNKLVDSYNHSLNHTLKYINSESGFTIINYNFLAWLQKSTPEFKDLGSPKSQQCIKNLCANWKAYFKALKAYKEHPELFTGYPQKPSYYEKNERHWIVLTKQFFKQEGSVITISQFPDLVIYSNRDVSSIALKTVDNGIRIRLSYKQEAKSPKPDNQRVYSIDLGVNNLATITSNTEQNPFIINGRIVKSINQYYNKRLSELKSLAKITNKRDTTKRIRRLSTKRDNLIKNYMHQASRYLINQALKNEINTIIIGNNTGWKQECNMGSVNNQNFVQIPFNKFKSMISYKAELEGIKVIVTEESYTSGTSYLDNEAPIKEKYNKKRRVHRGLFKSASGELINADVNGSYQIMKKVLDSVPIKHKEQILVINPLKNLPYKEVEIIGSSHDRNRSKVLNTSIVI